MNSGAQPSFAPAAPGARDVFALAWPMTLKAIFLHGTVVIDGYLLSSLGESALAAIGLAAALGGMVLGVIFAFSHAMQIRTAQAFGGGDKVFLKSVLGSGLTVSFGIGIIDRHSGRMHRPMYRQLFQRMQPKQTTALRLSDLGPD